ncbi:PucR family transcriptional regulator [Saccharopolyspora aridisoli]|uniref:PucR family transcriptional regulator n=1 Tax=Saccharopolyspora aridisoli TaxID=2530385 RepID=A0A4R4UTR8_9PSEU|nr:PucR family transcriptional regulator [Saccharopolyspora aridisoli]TDC95450.1 PucR family transcriptional regulator [Saccharopolyspora aridisoli]
MALTLREVLDLPAVSRGRPRVRAGSGRLETPVRWVHVSELPNVAGTLSGGDLVLSIGVVLAEPDTDLRAYVESLRSSGAAGLVVELGRHVQRLPDTLVQAARAQELPLVELQESVRFVEITQTVHAQVVNDQYERLRASYEAHRLLGSLGIEGAPTDEILHRCAQLTGRPVVLEDLAHRAMASAGELPVQDVLRDWSSRSRQVPTGPASTVSGPERWLSTPVGPRKRHWGRLVVPTRVDADEAEDVQLVLELTAEAVTVAGLVADTDTEGLAATKLIRDVLSGHAADAATIRARALALGFATEGSMSVTVVRGNGRGQTADAALVTAVTRAARSVQRAALVGRIREQMVAVLFDCTSSSDAFELPEELADALSDDAAAAIGAGSEPAGWADLAAVLTEAEHVATVAPGVPPGARPTVNRSRDLGLRSLLWQLREDSRLLSFVESKLGPVLALREDKREEVLRVLDAYLRHNGVMAEFARDIHLSRAAAYGRIRSIEQLLQLDLTDPEERTATHVALIAHRQANRSS